MTTVVPLWVDCETANDLDIAEVGTARYAETAVPIIITWALGDGPVRTWDILHHRRDGDLAADARRATVFRAANAPFDRLVLSQAGYLSGDPEHWECLTVRAYLAGWPRGGLDYLCNVLGIPEEQAKLKEGKALVKYFTRAFRVKRDPARWARFLSYARSDIISMRECWPRLPGSNDSPMERAVWLFDQHTNDRGWPVCNDTVRHACRLVTHEKAEINRQMNALTRGRVPTVNATGALREEMNATSVDADSVDRVLTGPLRDPVQP